MNDFEAIIRRGTDFKKLIDLVQNIKKDFYMVLSKDGIYSRMYDSDDDMKLYIYFYLPQDRFPLYETKYKEDRHIALKSDTLSTLMKVIKKGDSLRLSISGVERSKQLFEIISGNLNRPNKYPSMVIQDVQNIRMSVSDDYNRPVMIPSSEFKSICKDLFALSPMVTISATKFSITFSCDGHGICSNKIQFGYVREGDVELYSDTFDSDQLVRVLKIHALGEVISFHTATDHPLLIKSNVGELGTISIYVKSKTF